MQMHTNDKTAYSFLERNIIQKTSILLAVFCILLSFQACSSLFYF